MVALIGAGPWAKDSRMRYYCTDSEMLLDDVHLLELRPVRVKQIADKIRVLLFRAQPATPAAGRWTGVAQSSMWHACVTLFFNILLWLLTEVLKWCGHVSPAQSLEDLDGNHAGDPGLQRKFLGARRNLYVHFLEDNCPLHPMAMVFINAPVRRVLGFLFTHSYETRGSIAPQDQAAG